VVDFESRLARCFASVFPELTPDQIRQASTETVPRWDSLAAVTLVAVIEQEFSVQIDPLDLPELGSYGAVKAYVENQLAGS
jgi:acyl carrier protein